MSPLPLAASQRTSRRFDRRSRFARQGGVGLAIAVALASTAVPTRGMSVDPRTDAALRGARAGLAELRGAIDDYRRDHGTWPGRRGNRAGVRALGEDLLAGEHPYLGAVPANPVNGSEAVRVVECCDEPEEVIAAGEGAGWLYDAARGRIWLASTDRIGTERTRADGEPPRWMDL